MTPDLPRDEDALVRLVMRHVNAPPAIKVRTPRIVESIGPLPGLPFGIFVVVNAELLPFGAGVHLDRVDVEPAVGHAANLLQHAHGLADACGSGRAKGELPSAAETKAIRATGLAVAWAITALAGEQLEDVEIAARAAVDQVGLDVIVGAVAGGAEMVAALCGSVAWSSVAGALLGHLLAVRAKRTALVDERLAPLRALDAKGAELRQQAEYWVGLLYTSGAHGEILDIMRQRAGEAEEAVRVHNAACDELRTRLWAEHAAALELRRAELYAEPSGPQVIPPEPAAPVDDPIAPAPSVPHTRAAKREADPIGPTLEIDPNPAA